MQAICYTYNHYLLETSTAARNQDNDVSIQQTTKKYAANVNTKTRVS